MKTLAASPFRYLVLGVCFVLTVSVLAVIGYVVCGWSLGDALYMVVLTVYTVGFEEVHPIDTLALRAVTMTLIVAGCTGMIFLTGALVQVITLAQVEQILGLKRMTKNIDQLSGHVIVCGFGRVGAMLATELRAGKAQVLIVEQRPERCAQAQAQNFLCLQGEASDEAVLAAAGVERARTVASVLPSDAVNVFVTLSARAMNKQLQIIARAESPATERKLLQAGANAVVMPAHIGAEQVASLILFPGLANLVQFNGLRRQMELDLRALGLELEVVVAAAGAAFTGLSVAEIERTAGGQFMIVAVERAGTQTVERADAATLVHAGDGVTLLGRGGRAAMVRRFA